MSIRLQLNEVGSYSRAQRYGSRARILDLAHVLRLKGDMFHLDDNQQRATYPPKT